MEACVQDTGLRKVAAAGLLGCVSFRRSCGVFDSRGGEQGNGGKGKEIFNTYFEVDVPDLNFTTITDFYSSPILNNAMEGSTASTRTRSRSRQWLRVLN